ncbi:DUF396-domain-containing protein [Neocallimastix lanati (nom. inval.)]|jgi:cadmium resistance protein CadD (predicted permease)|uniref:DUF396-domain-containing protein n=1 Tax=Neocallimastix californiae TaxID=1754190 RepID=A0A1Y2AR06_9FUNG|nr:DUF396-domain-containing protein [Neocallimastix sp. JGI-2020a]ORY24998.1 DUF396-domain-containing protein [Neocallimastix californiae]|eukprot:ORY24998.1 DUF396-domain-containing protein [Neocallimastix californiae]
MIFTLIKYSGYLLAFLFVILSLACTLYYLAELVEENTVMTRKVIKYSIWTVMIIYILLWLFDELPFFRVIFSIFCHLTYSILLDNFPDIQISSPSFILSCILVIVDHFVWFNYFTRNYFPFDEIVCFFAICVWAVPFELFISLSANDNTLPYENYNSQQRKKNNFVKKIVNILLMREDNKPRA